MTDKIAVLISHLMVELKSIAESRNTPQQYIFQLSDLHIVDTKVLCGESRLKRLIDKHLKEIQPGDDIKVIYPIIF